METTQPPLQKVEESMTPYLIESSSNMIDTDIEINNTVRRERRNIFGKIVNNKNEPIYLVEVKNLSNSSDNVTYTNSNGEFIIFASPDDNVRISKERFRTETIKLKMNDNYTLEKNFPHLPIILGIIGFIYLVITFTFIGIGASLRKKETDKYKRNTLLAFIILSLPFTPFQPVFLVVLIILCAIYHKELNEDNSQLPVAVPVPYGNNQYKQKTQNQNSMKQNLMKQNRQSQNLMKQNTQNQNSMKQNLMKQNTQNRNLMKQNRQSQNLMKQNGQNQNLMKQNGQNQNVFRNRMNNNLVRQNIPFATPVEGINNNTSGIPYGKVVNNQNNLYTKSRQNFNNQN